MKNKPKRKITPHKGGRTARFEIRITPDAKKYIKALAEKKDCTMADIIEAWVEEDKNNP